MSKLKKWLPRLLCYLLISLIVGGTAYSWNARRLAGNAMPMPFGFGVSVVLSGSMEPTLSVNDLVLIHAEESYQSGDIVVYQEGYHLVIHRIVGIYGDTVFTRGDANNVDDAPFPIGQIKGRLVFSIPAVGLIVRFLQTAPGILLLLGLLIWTLVRSGRQEKEEKNAELDEIRKQIEELKHSMDETEEKASETPEPEQPETEEPEKAEPEPEQPETEATEPKQPEPEKPETEEPETAEPEPEEEHKEGSSPAGEGSVEE